VGVSGRIDWRRDQAYPLRVRAASGPESRFDWLARIKRSASEHPHLARVEVSELGNMANMPAIRYWPEDVEHAADPKYPSPKVAAMIELLPANGRSPIRALVIIERHRGGAVEIGDRVGNLDVMTTFTNQEGRYARLSEDGVLDAWLGYLPLVHDEVREVSRAELQRRVEALIHELQHQVLENQALLAAISERDQFIIQLEGQLQSLREELRRDEVDPGRVRWNVGVIRYLLATAVAAFMGTAPDLASRLTARDSGSAPHVLMVDLPGKPGDDVRALVASCDSTVEVIELGVPASRGASPP
jgi:hypothetical protein